MSNKSDSVTSRGSLRSSSGEISASSLNSIPGVVTNKQPVSVSAEAHHHPSGDNDVVSFSMKRVRRQCSHHIQFYINKAFYTCPMAKVQKIQRQELAKRIFIQTSVNRSRKSHKHRLDDNRHLNVLKFSSDYTRADEYVYNSFKDGTGDLI